MPVTAEQKPRWVHPDSLDRRSASGSAGMAAAPASREEVEEILKRLLITGRLRRIPRNPRHREIVLAVLCVDLERRRPYSELELNSYLKDRLALMRAAVDHVTCRRYLVDLGFIKRDRAGARYLLNYPRLEAALSRQAIADVEDRRIVAHTVDEVPVPG